MIEQHTLKNYVKDITNMQHRGGYFVATRLDEFSPEALIASTTYSRKDFYKISLVQGDATYVTNDTLHHISENEYALIFTNCEIPYRWEIHSGACKGYSCMFTEDFLPMHTYQRPANWPVFKAGTQSVFRLEKEGRDAFEALFMKMLTEQQSTYRNKYELLFIYVLECIHGALKLNPVEEVQPYNAIARLSDAFKLMLAEQFPVATPFNQVIVRTPQAFADKLAVHPNYLNRALKTATGKTTSQLITERIMQEAKALLLHSNWSVSQISYSLGFEEPTHFAKAFRKYTGVTPSSLRHQV